MKDKEYILSDLLILFSFCSCCPGRMCPGCRC